MHKPNHRLLAAVFVGLVSIGSSGNGALFGSVVAEASGTARNQREAELGAMAQIPPAPPSQAAPAPAPELTFEGRPLPNGWKLVSRTAVEGPTLERFANNLGVPLAALSNEVLDLHGLALQVNFIRTVNEADAAPLERALSAGGRAAYIARQGPQVIEFAKMNSLAAAALRHQLNLPSPAPTAWSADLAICPTAGSPSAQANQVFNLCLALERQPEDPALLKQLSAAVSGWRFSDRLSLHGGGPGCTLEYKFTPEPLEVTRAGDLLTARFGPLPKRHGLPYVQVQVSGQTQDRFGANGATLPSAQPPAPRWEAPEVLSLAEKLFVGIEDPRARLEAISAYVYTQIRFAGEQLGSRFGLQQVLQQGFGHCWDKSDVAIALCRATGLPARQVAGWVPPLASGHVWCEAYLPGEGWLPFDPTCPWLGTSDDYLPWFLSADGELEFAYLAMPKLEFKAPQAR